MDDIKIDSHKLIYHIPRLHQWLNGENIYPVYIEISLYGGCNHRCIFCAFDFLRYKPDILDKNCIVRFIGEAAKKGVKSVLYSGEGEPLLHSYAADIIIATKKAGIDTALSTNGVMLGKEKAARVLGSLTWLKFSVDAAKKKTYSFIHGTKKDDFDAAIGNIAGAVKIRDKHRHGCTIGVQYLLIPQNHNEVLDAAKLMRDIGVDYFVVKPYSRHPSGRDNPGSGINYKKLFYLQEKLDKLSKDDFRIMFRRHAMEKMGEDKSYKRCLGAPFAAHIKSNGDIYPCSLFLGKKEFAFGNICRESFGKIWESKRRKKIMDIIYNKRDVNNCRKSCRLDEINSYLWELKHPAGHVNFI